jgi:hypothetical protein
MRRALILAMAMFFVGLPAASVRAESGTFGIVAGATAASYGPADTGESITMSPGLAIGFYAVIPILKSVSFVPELLYVQRYSRRTVGSTTTDVRIEYVELPLLAKMPLFWGTYITEGVVLGFPVQMQGIPPSVAPNLAQLTSPDLSIVLGGGHALGKHMAIELRYDSGLRQISTVPTAPPQRPKVYMALAKLHF